MQPLDQNEWLVPHLKDPFHTFWSHHHCSCLLYSAISFRLLHDEADGTFLVRSDEGDTPFILSFVINNIVYNVKMEVKNEHLELGGKPTSMETIYDMVEHFRRVPIYRDVVTLKTRGG